MKTSTIRPGLLVAIKTSLIGNVQYVKRDIERDHIVDGVTRKATWETERTIADAAEHDRACKVRSEANHMAPPPCANTAFGSMCPEDKADELADTIVRARALVDAFNDTAAITRVKIYVIAGRVAADDVEAARAIRAELAEVIGDMERGVTNLSPDKIREAAAKAKELSEMLTDGAQYNVELAITAARSAATAINKAVKAGEAAALAVDAQVLTRLSSARLAFLDVEDGNEDQEPATIARPAVQGRSIDFGA